MAKKAARKGVKPAKTPKKSSVRKVRKPAAKAAKAVKKASKTAAKRVTRSAAKTKPVAKVKAKATAKGLRKLAKGATKRLVQKEKRSTTVRSKAKAAAILHPVSPLAPKSYETLLPLAGVQLATGAAGIKYQGRTDVLIAVLEPGTQVAGVFTRSKSASAPVEWCRAQLAQGSARVLVANSGNANAFTGKAGRESVREIAESAAAEFGCLPSEVFLASTGVIGEPLPAEKVTGVLGDLAKACSTGGWNEAARAIMTTDTFPKLSTATALIDGHSVTINGIAKGSGMIAPDMATLLAFVFTDAAIPAPVLQEMLSCGVVKSFNSITVDSDTSTSDTLIAFATGKGATHPAVEHAADPRLADFRQKFDAVLLDLALQIVRDGEGAQKLIQIDVSGAVSDASAHRIALSIANSPLVKTAVAGGDANWGRVVMAVGKAGEPADRDRLTIAFGGHVVAENGARAETYDEATASAALAGRAVEIGVDLGLGEGVARVWTCDLTDGYIRINGSYRN